MNSKNKWAGGLVAGLGMGIMTTLVIWLIGDNKTFEQALMLGFIGGIISAPIFVWTMTKAAKKVVAQTEQLLQVDSEGSEEGTTEIIIKQTNATHFHKLEGTGGVLILTAKRLLFQSHGMNIQDHQWETQLCDIQRFNRRKTLGIIPNGLEIWINGQEKSERFVVIGAQSWHDALHQAINQKGDA